MTSRPASDPDRTDTPLSAIKRAFLAVDALQTKLDAVERARTEPIAIVGIGCRFPGGVRDPEAYWTLLRDGVNAISAVPADRWDAAAYYDSDPNTSGKMYTRAGGFLDAADLFDASFFGISPREAASMDPQQRLLLEVSWDALEHAGEPADRLAGSRTAVYVGICTNDYAHLQVDDPTRFDLYYGSGIAHSIAAGRLSYVLGLCGPSLSVDTACSSSLVALHLACQSLRSGECEMALVGAVNVMLSPENMITFSQSRMLAADGRCKTFDAAADGFVNAEGCGVVVVKRLSDAIAAGNRILAVVRGTAVNQDGASTGLTAPNGPAQEAVIRDALANGKVEPAHVDYVEAHGTGTVLGDPIEVQALGAVLREGRAADAPLMIGSAKTNIGHLQAAAGMAGLIKVVLALQHQEVPPHLNLERPNPYIPWADLPVIVPTRRTPWPSVAGRRRLAGVSSFGFSGTNAHVILEEAPVLPVPPGTDRHTHLLTLSARSATALRRRADDLRQHLATAPDDGLGDICVTANTGRAHLEHRLAIVTSSRTHLEQTLSAYVAGEEPAEVRVGHTRPTEAPPVAFLFPGQGAQYPGMARQLYETEPVFRAALQRCAGTLEGRLKRPLLEVLYGSAGAALEETACAQPALFALEYALAEMWRGWGVQPTFLIGHSLGELAAATVAGLMAVEDALALVVERGRLMQELMPRGAMVALEGEEAEVATAVAAEAATGGVVAIAAVNGPRSVVISGTEQAVGRVTAALAARNVPGHRLPGDRAFHSPLLEPVLAPLEAAAARVTYRSPSIGLISTLTGTVVPPAEMERAQYWRDQARGTVRFARAMQTLWARGIRVCIEIGPQPVLIGLGQRCVAGGVWAGSLRRGRDDWRHLLEALGQLFVTGLRINFDAVDGRVGHRRVSLPTYPFERRRYWLRPAGPSTQRRPAALPDTNQSAHPLLGCRLHSPALKEIVFDARLDLERLPFLGDHRVFGQALYPATAYLESAAAAARVAFGDGPHRLEDVVIGERLTLSEGEPRCVQLILSQPAHGQSSFSCLSVPASKVSAPDEKWQLHASGTVSIADSPDDEGPARVEADPIRARCQTERTADEHYRCLAARGFDFGPAFRGVERVWHREGEALARLQLSSELTSEADLFGCHPAILDAGLQALAAALPDPENLETSETHLPLRISRFIVYGPAPRRLWSHAVVNSATAGQAGLIIGDVRLFDDRGHVVAEIMGVHLKRVARETIERATPGGFQDWLYEVQWPLRPLPTVSPFADEARPDPHDIARRLRPAWSDLSHRHELTRYDVLLPALDTLSTAYVVTALRALGCPLHLGDRFRPEALAAHLGVVAGHHRLFGRMLEMLEEDGIIVRRSAEFEVCREPAADDVPARQAALAASFPAYEAEVALLGRCGPALAEALRGHRDPLELVFPGGVLTTATQLYEQSPVARAHNTLLGLVTAAVVERMPTPRRIRVLEVGAGTGGSTGFVLPTLPPERTDYLFTDISKAFVVKAAEKFRRYPFVRYRVLDIERPSTPQGFAEDRFDLVIAANVLHATRDLRQALRNVQDLLAPNGVMILLEMIAAQRDVDLVFGLMEGWWRFADRDLRPRYPLLPSSRWVALLDELKFRDAVAIPAEIPGAPSNNQAVVIACRPTDGAGSASPAAREPGRWLLVGDSDGVGAALAASLEHAGEYCRLLTVSDDDPVPMGHRLAAVLAEDDGQWRGVVYLVGLERAASGTGSPSELQPMTSGGLLHLVQALIARRLTTRLWIVTRGAQAIGGERPHSLDPARATLWGMAKVIAIEHPELPCVRIDLDPATQGNPIELEGLVAELCGADGEEEIVHREGRRHVARLCMAAPVPQTRRDQPVRLEISEAGILDNLVLRSVSREAPGRGEVEIAVHATGLNFRDVMEAMGVSPAAPSPLGGECAGTIAAVGEGVDGLRVGDPVIALAAGSFGTYAITRADWVAPKPPSWTFEEGATVLIPFVTADYALHHVGRLRRGERVLIHAAAGGVGLAAVQLAQRAGAEIFATAGSPEKRAFLRSQGIRHVMSSRSTAFAAELMAVTNGGGVDLVLNSLAGELVMAGLSVLAPGGRFLEIGKTSILSEAQRAAVRPEISYHAVDASAAPHMFGAVIRSLMDRFAEGALRPLPVRSFPLRQAAGAFRHMAQARHIGKIAIRQEPEERGSSAPSLIRPDASYLVTGGLGGLGLVLARHLVEGGARHLVLMGRTAPSPSAAQLVADLERSGARVVVVGGDVSREEDVARAFSKLAELPPLRGVIHAAGVLHDGVLQRLDWPRFTDVFSPKVEGAWQLARRTRGVPLDFFVLFSSMSSLLGSAGQANHAAANAFLDTLAHDLRAQGVRAVSINWGVWSEVGAAAERNVGARIVQQGVGTIPPVAGCLVFDEVLRRDRPQVAVLPVQWSVFRQQYRAGRVPTFLTDMVVAASPLSAVEGRSEALPALVGNLTDARPEQRQAQLIAHLHAHVVRVLGFEPGETVDPSKPLSELGLDSLMAVELRNRLQHKPRAHASSARDARVRLPHHRRHRWLSGPRNSQTVPEEPRRQQRVRRAMTSLSIESSDFPTTRSIGYLPRSWVTRAENVRVHRTNREALPPTARAPGRGLTGPTGGAGARAF